MVSPVVCKKWIKCYYNNFMMIPVEEKELDESDSVRKGNKKRLKGFQRQEDIKSIKEVTTEINSKMDVDYKTAYDALPKRSS